MKNIRKNLLRIALGILGLNVFTACYGVPPTVYEPLPEEEEVAATDVTDEAEETEGESESEGSYEL